MRNKDFEKLLKEAIIQEAEEQGRALIPDAEPIPEEAQARFDAALNGTRKKSKRTIDDMPSEQPQPVKRAHRWLAYGLTAVSAAAVVLVVALILGTGMGGTKAQEPADVQPPQAETTSAPLPEPGEAEPEPGSAWEDRLVDTWVIWKKTDANGETVSYAGRHDEFLLVFKSDGMASMIQQGKIENYYYTAVVGSQIIFANLDRSFSAVYDPEADVISLQIDKTGETLLFVRELLAETLFEIESDTIAADDGLGGIGNLRGNTNGNLAGGGRAVSTGKKIYYIDQEAAHLRICCYDLLTGETTLLMEDESVDMRDAGELNYSSGYPGITGEELYFVVDESPERSSVKQLSLTDRSVKTILSDKTISGLYCIYGLLYYVGENSTTQCMMNGWKAGEIDNFRMIGAMGGLLYGSRDGRIVALDPSMFAVVQSYDLDGDVYVANGYLIGCTLKPTQEGTYEIPEITLVNVSTGKSVTVTEPTLSYGRVVNIGKDGIYLMENGYLSVGSIYCINWDGTGLRLVRRAYFELDPMLWWDTFLVNYVPCDDIITGVDSIIPPEIGLARAEVFFQENRELLERARTENPSYYPYLNIRDGQGLFQRPNEDMFAIIDTQQLPEDLQTLVAMSAKTGLAVYWDGQLWLEIETNQYEQELPFTDSAESCFVVVLPENTNQDQSAYDVWLIYTESFTEVIAEEYRDKVQPIADNWYIYQYSHANDATEFTVKNLVGTWTMVDPPSSAQGYTFELVFESEEKVTLKVSMGEQSGDIAFSYIFENNTVHLYMESYEVYPDGSIMKEKQEYYLFVSGGVITYDLETDSLLVPNDEGGQTRFIRKAG